jgi:DNA modification methylase
VNKSILKTSYQLLNKEATEATWPLNSDLLITRLPSMIRDGYSKGLVGFIANKAYSSLNNNTLAYVIISSFREDKNRPFEVANIFVSAGFKFVDCIVWIKNKVAQTQGGKRLNNGYEFILLFAKGSNYHLDRKSIAHLKNRIDNSDTDYICPGNVWKIGINNDYYLPEELIQCIIKLSNLIPNSIILNPFANDGIVLKMANQMGHSYWGCESNKTKYRKCKKIIKQL